MTASGVAPRTKTRFGFVLRLLVSALLLLLIFHFVDLSAVAGLYGAADLPLLAVGLLVSLADRALMIAKWHPLLIAQVPGIPFTRVARVYLASGFAALFLPATVGGDVLRAIGLGRGRQVVVEIGASIAAERLLGMIASALFTSIALLLALQRDIQLRFLVPWAVTSLAVTAAVTLLPLSRRATGWLLRFLQRHQRIPMAGLIHRFATAYALYRRHLRTLLVVGGLSVVEQAFPIIVMWVFSRALGTSVRFSMLLIAIPLIMFVARLPIAVAGIGPVEGAYVYLLGLFGVNAVEALALAVAARLGELVGVLPGALFWNELAGTRATDPEVRSDRTKGNPRPGDFL